MKEILKLLLIKWGKEYYILVFIICTFFWFSCHNEVEKQANHQDGVVPISIKQVVDVFELKYGEIKECNYNGQEFTFSIVDVIDSIKHPDVTAYIDPSTADWIRIYALLQIQIKKNIYQADVCSSKWSPNNEFSNDDTDVQQVWNLLNLQHEYDLQSFVTAFGTGTLITETSYSIFMAKAYPFASKMNNTFSKNISKFIFIITNQKIK